MSFIDFLDEHLGEVKDIGHERRYNCPFCEWNTDFKFYVSTGTSGPEGLWYCFKCSEKGNPISFVMKYQGCNYQEAKDTLELYDYEFDNFTEYVRESGMSEEEALILMMNKSGKEEEVVEEDEVYTAPPLPVGYKRIVDNLDKTNEVAPFVDYLVNKRGFSVEDIYVHNIGYITEGYTETESGKKVWLNNHVIFLTHDDNGNYQYWNSRSIEPDPYIKTFNGVAKEGQYSKRNSVFNLNRAKYEPEIYLCEGVPDALTLGKGGIATFGKQVTDEQIKEITKDLKNKQVIYVTLDMDAKKEMLKVAERLYKVHENTYIVLNDTGKDPNDLGREKALELIHSNSVKANDTGGLLLMLA